MRKLRPRNVQWHSPSHIVAYGLPVQLPALEVRPHLRLPCLALPDQLPAQLPSHLAQAWGAVWTNRSARLGLVFLSCHIRVCTGWDFAICFIPEEQEGDPLCHQLGRYFDFSVPWKVFYQILPWPSLSVPWELPWNTDYWSTPDPGSEIEGGPSKLFNETPGVLLQLEFENHYCDCFLPNTKGRV